MAMRNGCRRPRLHSPANAQSTAALDIGAHCTTNTTIHRLDTNAIKCIRDQPGNPSGKEREAGRELGTSVSCFLLLVVASTFVEVAYE